MFFEGCDWRSGVRRVPFNALQWRAILIGRPIAFSRLPPPARGHRRTRSGFQGLRFDVLLNPSDILHVKAQK